MILKEQQDGVVPNYGEQKTSGLHYSGAFENGQAAMCNMGSWFLATMQKYNAEASANASSPSTSASSSILIRTAHLPAPLWAL